MNTIPSCPFYKTFFFVTFNLFSKDFSLFLVVSLLSHTVHTREIMYRHSRNNSRLFFVFSICFWLFGLTKLTCCFGTKN